MRRCIVREMSKMSADERLKNDLKRLDYSTGGRIRAVVNRITTIDNPILIIGLGGTGINALIRAKRLIADRMTLTDGSDKPANVDYLGIDTDSRSFRSVYKGMRLSEDERLLYEYSDIAKVVENRANSINDDIKQWFSNDVDVAQIKNGAGAYRQVGRFILFQNISTLNKTLDTKMQRIQSGASKDIYVFVFTGISGGTGSGTFLDMGYILQSVASRLRYGLRSFLMAFLPDVNLKNIELNSSAEANIKRNGFAALKEMDYLNNLKIHGTAFTQDYGCGVAVTQTQTPPYEATVLFSGRRADGTNVDYDTVMAVASESVVNIIADEQLEDDVYTINSLLSNIANLQDTYISKLGARRHAASYKYVIAGAASAYIPVDDLVSYLTYQIFDAMSEMWNKPVDPDDVHRVITAFRMDEQNIKNDISGAVKTTLPDLSGYTYDDFKNGNRDILKYCDEKLSKQRQEVDEAAERIVERIKQAVMEPGNIIDSDYFLNTDYGPAYAQGILYKRDAQAQTVIRYCLDSKDSSLRKMTNPTVLQKLENETRRATEIEKITIVEKAAAAVGRSNVCAKHIDNIESFYNARLSDYIYNKMSSMYGDIYKLFVDKNNNVYAKLKGIVDELHMMFGSYAGIMSNTHERVEGNSHILSWNIISVPDFVQGVQTMMEKDPSLQVKIDEAVGFFYNEFLVHFDEWTNFEDHSIVDTVNERVADLFEGVLHQTMDSYIEAIAAQNGTTSDSYYSNIFNELTDKAICMFEKSDATYPAEKFAYMTVPENCRAMYEYFNAKKAPNDILKRSMLSDKIYKINFEVCVSIDNCAQINDYEVTYEKLRHTPALHLYEPTREGGSTDWSLLPSPCPSTMWTTAHRAAMTRNITGGEADRTARYFDIFDKAEKYGYIYVDDADKEYYLLRGQKTGIDMAAVLRNAGVDDINSSFTEPAAAQRALNELKAAMHLTDNGFDRSAFEVYPLNRLNKLVKNGVSDRDFTREYFYKNLVIRDEMAAAVAEFEKYIEVTNKLGEFVGGGTDFVTLILDVMSTKVLRKRNSTLFAFADKNGQKQTVMNVLTDCRDLYQYYVLHQKLRELDERTVDYLKERANAVMSAPTREQADDMTDWLERFSDKLSADMSQLRENARDVIDADDKLRFYKSLKRKTDERLALIKGINLTPELLDEDDDDGDDM